MPLPEVAHVDETTHNDVASDEETEVVDVEYSDIPVEHNDLLKCHCLRCFVPAIPQADGGFF